MPQPSNPYLGLVAQYAQQAGIDPKWAQATLLTENTPGDPRAVSPAGAVGLMQVMPANAAGANLADPMANIQRGVQILAANLKAAGGDKSKASAMYFRWAERKDLRTWRVQLRQKGGGQLQQPWNP